MAPSMGIKTIISIVKGFTEVDQCDKIENKESLMMVFAPRTLFI